MGGVWLEGEGGRAEAIGRPPNADITCLLIYLDYNIPIQSTNKYIWIIIYLDYNIPIQSTNRFSSAKGIDGLYSHCLYYTLWCHSLYSIFR